MIKNIKKDSNSTRNGKGIMNISTHLNSDYLKQNVLANDLLATDIQNISPYSIVESTYVKQILDHKSIKTSENVSILIGKVTLLMEFTSQNNSSFKKTENYKKVLEYIAKYISSHFSDSIDDSDSLNLLKKVHDIFIEFTTIKSKKENFFDNFSYGFYPNNSDEYSPMPVSKR